MTVRKQSPQVKTILKRLGIARSRDLEAAGVSRTRIRRLLTEGRHLAEASLAVPGGVLCLLSALRFHALTTQNPFGIWMAIDRKAWRPRRTRPPLRLIYMTSRSLYEGVERHAVDGVPVQVFSAARTVADCFKFRKKVGIDVAVEALRAYRRQFPRRLDALWKFAESNRVVSSTGS